MIVYEMVGALVFLSLVFIGILAVANYIERKEKTNGQHW